MTEKKKGPGLKKAGTVSRETVRAVKVDGRDLITFDLGKEKQDHSNRNLKGAIVRIRPGRDTTDDDINLFKAMFRNAERIIVLPKPKGEVVPGEVRERVRTESARKVVEALAAESNSGDRERLVELTGKIMDEVGL